MGGSERGRAGAAWRQGRSGLTMDVSKSERHPLTGGMVPVPGIGRLHPEPVDGEDSFPPAVARYEAIDGWLVYHGRNGSIGVIVGSPRDLAAWMGEVDRWTATAPARSREPWSADRHGGEANVAATMAAARETLRRFGIDGVTLEAWVDPSPNAPSDASRRKIQFANPHLDQRTELLGVSVPKSRQLGAHEASHVGMIEHNAEGRAVIEVLQRREARGLDYLSLYHALAGHGEGLAEAGAAYVLIPDALRQHDAELYDAVARWFGEAPHRNGRGARLRQRRFWPRRRG